MSNMLSTFVIVGLMVGEVIFFYILLCLRKKLLDYSRDITSLRKHDFKTKGKLANLEEKSKFYGEKIYDLEQEVFGSE